jgi:hypothetical protein
MRRADGFSMLEMVVATAVMMAVVAAVFSVMNPIQGAFQTQLDVADMQQRLRVAHDTLYADLIMAGAGTDAGSLLYNFAPVVPYRRGLIGDAGPAAYRDDTLTIIYIPSTPAKTTTSQIIPGDAGPVTLTVNQQAGCPVGAELCGFAAGQTVLVLDGTGDYDTFKLTSVVGAAGTMSVNRAAAVGGHDWPAGLTIVHVVSRTYYLSAASRQLMYYDGSGNPDVPIVDHVVGLKFEYYGDPQPPILRRPLDDAGGPWTTYGPAPPDGTAQGAFASGENCTFAIDRGASPPQVPRLAALGADPVRLVPLAAAQLTDGPWCPDAGAANRWDADLLRIRKVLVTIRVEAAVDALRGPAGYLFTNGGTARNGTSWVPDQEIRFEVSPRNLNLGR